jgi:SPP1 gp7 family putative phage head morphogenesis protein
MPRLDLRTLLGTSPRKLAKRTPRTRAERQAMAPAQPVAIQVRYTKALFDLLDGFRLASLSVLEPLFSPGAAILVKTGSTLKQDATDYLPLFQQLRLRLGKLTEEPRLIALVESIARDVDAKSITDISRILQIDLSSDNVLREYLTQFVRENTNLIRSMTVETLGRMEDLVRQSQAGQIRVEELRDSILESFDVSKSRATLIARDQTLKANADLSQLRQQRAGVTEYIWSCSRDERVRGNPGGKYRNSDSDHWSLDGQRFSWLSPPVTNPVTGARNHPGRDFQCRCVALPVTDSLLSDL